SPAVHALHPGNRQEQYGRTSGNAGFGKTDRTLCVQGVHQRTRQATAGRIGGEGQGAESRGQAAGRPSLAHNEVPTWQDAQEPSSKVQRPTRQGFETDCRRTTSA